MAASVQPEEPDQETSEPLKYKTWVLKVSIHCEGCKRKVKRILHSVEGVYTIDVDTKQHKVVITGNVEANTLLRKLEKSGKHAELWPNKYNYSHPDEQQQQQQQQQEQQQQQQNEDEQNQNVENNDQQQQQQQQQQQHPQNSCPPPQNMVREVRFEGNIPATGGNPNTPGNDASGGGGGGGGSGGAKKKKKKKKSNSSGNSASNNNSAVNNNNEVNNCGPPQTEPPPPQQPQQPPQQQQQQYMGPGPGSGSGQGMYPNPSPGVNRVYEYPPTHHAPPPPTLPACGMSYNTAYPRRYTSSYYSTQQPYSYAYVHQGGDVEMSMPLDLGAPSLQPSDTFEIFSDENPNACSLM